MPSPIGHALAGAALAWTADAWHRRDSPTLTIACVGLAMAPDLDLLLPQAHRTFSHSLTAVAAVTIVAAVVTGQVTGRITWRIPLLCAAAYASHILLDWLAVDDTTPRGLQILWPFSHHWFISELDIFSGTARRHIFSARSIRTNLTAIAWEITILGPLATAAWLVRIKTLAGFAPKVSRSDHPA